MLRAGIGAGLGAGAIWGLSGCGEGDGDGDGANDGANNTGADVSRPGAVPTPAGMVRTSWSTDPYALGSYSYLPVGATPQARAALAEPVGGRLFFAGEAVHADNPATVHGAQATGYAVAAAVDNEADAGELIVVVGAGIAGATAAQALVAAGHEVIVVEAQARVGGRLHTVRPAGWPVPVERGASWVHAIHASNLADELDALGVATVPFEYADVVVGADGELADDDFTDGVSDAVEAAIEWADELDDDVSLADALVQSGAAAEVDAAALAHFLRTELTTEYGADADELSAWWGTEEGSEGDDLLVVGGYGALVDAALTGLEVRLGWPVAGVAHGDDGVVVTGPGGEVIEADRVIVTVPLGVLKAGAIAFDPPLPAGHQQAIEAMAMGLLDKVWLRWDEPWWSETAEQWTRVAAADDSFTEWFNLAGLTGAPVLLGLVGGAEARGWAARSDDEVLAAALASLDQFRAAGF